MTPADIADSDLWCALPEPDQPTFAADRAGRALQPGLGTAVRALATRSGVTEAAVHLAAYLILLDAHGVPCVDRGERVSGLIARCDSTGNPSKRYVFGAGEVRFDTTLVLTVNGDAVELRYRVELIHQVDAELLLARYETVLTAITADPGVSVAEVPAWSARDHEVISAANDTAQPVRPRSMLERVQHVVRTTPDAIAVVEGDRSVTYRQLWNAAHEIAALIRGNRSGPADVVAVALPRSAELVAAVLGIWLTGAAYVPIDAAHPEDRIRYQLADSGANLLLATADLVHFATEERHVLVPPAVQDAPQIPATGPVTVDPAACAYLIYTSGSTGRPKGTRIHHEALANLAAHFADQLTARVGDSMLWMTTFAFDMSGVELFVPLASGGRLVPAPDAVRTDGRVLRELVERHDVRFVQATPTTWRLVLDRVEGCLRGRTVLSGGEVVPAWLAQRLVAAGAEFHHCYGPTETTIWSTSRVITDASQARLDVGPPIRNTQVFVRDEHGRDLPIGVRGELCIAGVGVALGYHDRPDLNAQRFGEHETYGRFYRTGDVARWRVDGTLDLFGRSDRQVKLRGNRIELGEIEAVLLAHPQVDAAAVIMIGDPSADAVLVGCLESASGPITIESVWTLARAQLSKAMLPGDLVAVDALPINGSGKVDYPALERLLADRRVQRAEPAAAADLVDVLTTLWAKLLQRDDVTAETNFFEYGGSSMLAAWALQEVQNLTGVSLALNEIFERPTPRSLATHVLATAPATS
ncbi:amino acid adenylation domain-containing protein [Actinoplanes sp. N902-109]|uniref:non-ribosomal peptide synthetase n=1 Tax=Actinoplanes sp. (strain N902-109) TaxID=649831 RepID=UPI001E2A35DF|nr:non-ribosomal peptide synthetase [Actinoplanes sp. N902-109]